MASMGDASGPMPAIQDMRAPRVCYHLNNIHLEADFYTI